MITVYQGVTVTGEPKQQVEKVTIIGSATGAVLHYTQIISINPTASLITALVGGESASTVAGLIRDGLNAKLDVTDFYIVSGTGPDIVLTSKLPLENDNTLNIRCYHAETKGLPEVNSVTTELGTITLNKETTFTSNGLGVLPDTISCFVEEELNGLFECTLEHPLDTRGKWEYLLENNVLKVDGQLFRIYRKVKTLTSIKINARHIFYDLLDNFLEDVRPTNLSGAGALDWILTRTQYAHGFTSVSDVGGTDTKYYIRKNLVEAIMGPEGIIANWGGELKRDNHIINLLQARGSNRGVLVAYGKNIIGIEETLDGDGICTRMMPKGIDGLLLPEKYIDSQYIANYPHPKIKVVEFDIGVDEENGITEAIAIEQLRAAATEMMLNGKIDVPISNYKVDFLELSKTEEYKNYSVLERVYLGDTITVRHARLKLDLTVKVIKVTKNALTDRIEKVELGSFKPNIASGINNAIQTVKKDIVNVTSAYQKAIDNATALITGASGGNVVIRTNEAGKPYEILIMDTLDVLTAVNVWRWNIGGFGYSSTGINGPYEVAITMDGHIVASFIQALTISGEQIIAGTITSQTGKLSIDLDDEVLSIGGKIVYDGATGIVTFAPDVLLSWDNIDGAPAPYTDAEALAAWVNSGYKTWIGTDGLYTGTINANKINVGTLNGFTLTGATINALNTMNIGTDGDANPKLTLKNDWAGELGISWIHSTPANTGGPNEHAIVGIVVNSANSANRGLLTISGYPYEKCNLELDGNISADSFIGPLSGNASTATNLGGPNSSSGSITINSGEYYDFYHGLGRIPLFVLDGTLGNIQLTTQVNSSYIRLYNYNGGANSWTGVIYAW